MSGHPFSLDNGRARPTLLAVGEGVACLNMDIFALSLSLSLSGRRADIDWNTVTQSQMAFKFTTTELSTNITEYYVHTYPISSLNFNTCYHK